MEDTNMKAIICTCIKDECDYLAEWIEYHLALGFEHIFLFEDVGSKSHAEIVDKYDRVTMFPISVAIGEPEHRERIQMKAYTYSIKKFKDDYDWAAFIDADEFIEFEDGYSLDRLLGEYAEYMGIMLSWRLYGANGRVKRPKGGVIDSYPEYDDTTDYIKVWGGAEWAVKSIANLKKNPTMKHIHWAHGAINMNGGYYPECKVYKKAWIRHYYTKSWEDWVYRIMKRGDLCNANRKLNHFFRANPDMKHLQNELIMELGDQIPVGSYILDDYNMIIAGGNINIINRLNYEASNTQFSNGREK